jgi:NAD(P)-dependent dehydrogenase (short-subunit alcohol dehydrogenase family)
MRIDLKGKNCLVTGAGSGIGRGCARLLAEAGAFVWVNDLEEASAKRVAKEVGGEALPGDVALPGDWLKPVLDRGTLHALIHNAGYDLTTRVGQTERSEFERLLAIQVTGPFEMTQRLLPSLRKANGASVIHIASVHAIATVAEMSAYSACKGALVSMVRSMAQDLGADKIRALAVSPGYVDTPLLEEWIQSTPDPKKTREHAEQLHPLGRIGTPEDIAALVTYLVSPLAEFINGTNVVIDGGLTSHLWD